MVVAAVGDLPCFKDLIAVLFECLLIISLGYLSGRFNLISTQAKDLNSYLTTFALPMIIFLNIAQMEFQTINLSFLFCMLTAKLLVFILVTIITLTISYPRNFGYAGALSILATQSNDFALGYPLIKSLYGETKPEMLNYLSLMAPIQLLILNPLGIAMLEYNKSNLSKSRSNQQLVIETPRQCCNHVTSSPSSSSNANYQNKSEQTDTPSNNSQQDTQSQPKQQLRLRRQGNTLARNLPQGSLSGETANRSPVSCCGIVTDRWQQSGNQPHDQTSVANGYHHNHNMAGVIKGDRIAKLMGFKHRNIKTLTLVMPPASNSTICGSDDSIDTLNENRLVDCGFTQTRAKHNPATIDCQLVQPSINCSHQNLNHQPQHPPAIAMNVDLPAVVCADCAGSATIQPNPINVTAKLCSAVNLNFLKALATNPLIIASVIALLVNLIHGPELPKFVTRVSNTIAASFASPALFVVGLSMYGKFELFRRNPSELLLSSVLVLTKVLILPSLMRTLAIIILPKYTPTEELNYLIDFSFLYGLLPTAPTACIIANQYGVLANVVSISMLLSTFLSTPLMMASAFIINPASVIKVEVIEAILSQTMQVSSIVTLTLALLTLYAFWKSRKSLDNSTHFINITQIARESINGVWAKPTHVFLLLLAISQVLIGVGGLIWYFVDTSKLNTALNTFDTMHYPLATVKENLSRISFDDNVTSFLPSELPETVTVLPVPMQELLAPSSEPLPGLESISGLDMPPPLEPPPVAEPLPEPAALSEQFDSRVTTPRLHHIDLGLRTLSTAQYVLSSYGLMMARFVLLCLLLVIAAIKFRREVVVERVAEIMLKTYLILAATLLIWLVFDTDQPQHLPVEASLPNQTSSLWVRLLHDIVILVVSIPLFALIMRSYNKDKLIQNDNLIVSDDEVGPELIKRRFVTSTASLSSDASSALTSNTNLESSSNASQCVQVPQDMNNNIPSSLLNDSMSIVMEDGHFEITKRSISPVDGPIVAPLSTISSSINNSSDDQRIGTLTENDQNRNYELDDPTTNESTRPAIRSRYYLTLPEFNKYSILIVFILINTAHNLTSIAQKLLHHESFGTFRQIEVTNAALEFGQGLMTFLIFGMKGFFN